MQGRAGPGSHGAARTQDGVWSVQGGRGGSIEAASSGGDDKTTQVCGVGGASRLMPRWNAGPSLPVQSSARLGLRGMAAGSASPSNSQLLCSGSSGACKNCSVMEMETWYMAPPGIAGPPYCLVKGITTLSADTQGVSLWRVQGLYHSLPCKCIYNYIVVKMVCTLLISSCHLYVANPTFKEK